LHATQTKVKSKIATPQFHSAGVAYGQHWPEGMANPLKTRCHLKYNRGTICPRGDHTLDQGEYSVGRDISVTAAALRVRKVMNRAVAQFLVPFSGLRRAISAAGEASSR